MKFRPLHDRLLIRRVEQEAKTTGGIIIPDTAQEKPMEGEVIAVGPGSRGEDGKVHPLDVEAGDRVLFGKWSGTSRFASTSPSPSSCQGAHNIRGLASQAGFGKLPAIVVSSVS